MFYGQVTRIKRKFSGIKHIVVFEGVSESEMVIHAELSKYDDAHHSKTFVDMTMSHGDSVARQYGGEPVYGDATFDIETDDEEEAGRALHARGDDGSFPF